jgi:hypothetical protein
MRRIFSLALVFVATIFLVSLGLEAGARVVFSEQLQNRCGEGVGAGKVFKANCTSQPMKYWEGPWLTYSYNDCGYRSADSCHATAPELLRVAVVGTSMANGMFVPYQDTFAARTEASLKAACPNPVNFQNLALPAAANGMKPLWHHILDRVSPALALHPAALVTVVSSLDLSYYNEPPASLGEEPLAASQTGPSLRERAANFKRMVSDSRAILVMRRVMFSNETIYLDHVLKAGESASYLYPKLPPIWQMRLRVAASVLGATADKARAAGVPFLVFYYPTYQQAAAAQARNRPELTPLGLDDRLRDIVEAHGGHFIDMTPVIAAQLDVPGLYYVSNDHPNSKGHALMARELTKALVEDAPQFADCKGRR